MKKIMNRVYMQIVEFYRENQARIQHFVQIECLSILNIQISGLPLSCGKSHP